MTFRACRSLRSDTGAAYHLFPGPPMTQSAMAVVLCDPDNFESNRSSRIDPFSQTFNTAIIPAVHCHLLAMLPFEGE